MDRLLKSEVSKVEFTFLSTEEVLNSSVKRVEYPDAFDALGGPIEG